MNKDRLETKKNQKKEDNMAVKELINSGKKAKMLSSKSYNKTLQLIYQINLRENSLWKHK